MGESGCPPLVVSLPAQREMPRSFEKEMRQSRILGLMPALVPSPLFVWLYINHFREEKEHVVNRMDHWLLALGPGAALVFNGPAKKYRGNPKARSLSSIY